MSDDHWPFKPRVVSAETIQEWKLAIVKHVGGWVLSHVLVAKQTGATITQSELDRAATNHVKAIAVQINNTRWRGQAEGNIVINLMIDQFTSYGITIDTRALSSDEAQATDDSGETVQNPES